MARWGLHIKKFTQPLLSNIKDPRVYFCRLLFSHLLYEPYVRKHIETGLKFLTIQQKRFYISVTWYKRSLELSDFLGSVKKKFVVVCAWCLSSNDWLPAETFQRGAEKPNGAPFCHASTKFLTADLNISFYAPGHVELWKRSQKIREFKRFIPTLPTVHYVRVMPDFKAVVVACRQFFVALLICLDAVKSAFDGRCWIVFRHIVLAW